MSRNIVSSHEYRPSQYKFSMFVIVDCSQDDVPAQQMDTLLS